MVTFRRRTRIRLERMKRRAGAVFSPSLQTVRPELNEIIFGPIMDAAIVIATQRQMPHTKPEHEVERARMKYESEIERAYALMRRRAAERAARGAGVRPAQIQKVAELIEHVIQIHKTPTLQEPTADRWSQRVVNEVLDITGKARGAILIIRYRANIRAYMKWFNAELKQADGMAEDIARMRRIVRI